MFGDRHHLTSFTYLIVQVVLIDVILVYDKSQVSPYGINCTNVYWLHS